MSTSMSVIYSLSLPPGVTTYSASTLTAAITTIVPTTSVYTTEGRILTTTTPVATVFPAGTTLIFPTPPEPPKKKGNLVVIIAASLGGFIGLVLIGVIYIIWRRRRRSQGAKPRPASPDRRPSIHNFPTASVIHHPPSITPFGYQSPEHAQPHYDPQLMSQVHRDSQNNVILAPPSQPLSEKQRRNMLQRSQHSQQQLTNQPGMMSQSSMDDNRSIVSQSYTTSSVISSSVATQGQQQYYQQQPFTTPGHQHQRSMSANSTTRLMQADARSASPVSTQGGVAESPPPRLVQSHSYLASANHNTGAPGMHVLREEVEGGGPDQYYPQQQNQQNPRQSVVYPHPQPHPQPQFLSSQMQHQYQNAAAGSSSDGASSSQPQAGGTIVGGGARATVTRDGGVAEVILAKNNTIRAQERNRPDWDVEESMTNPSELPPTYESLQQSRRRRG